MRVIKWIKGLKWWWKLIILLMLLGGVGNLIDSSQHNSSVEHIQNLSSISPKKDNKTIDNSSPEKDNETIDNPSSVAYYNRRKELYTRINKRPEDVCKERGVQMYRDGWAACIRKAAEEAAEAGYKIHQLEAQKREAERKAEIAENEVTINTTKSRDSKGHMSFDESHQIYLSEQAACREKYPNDLDNYFKCDRKAKIADDERTKETRQAVVEGLKRSREAEESYGDLNQRMMEWIHRK